jgi:hypothetical protein
VVVRLRQLRAAAEAPVLQQRVQLLQQRGDVVRCEVAGEVLPRQDQRVRDVGVHVLRVRREARADGVQLRKRGVVGTGSLQHVSTLCALAPPPGLHGVVGTGVLRGSLWIRKWAPCSTSGPSIRQTEPSTILYGKVKVEISKVSLGCGRLSVGGEVTNRVTIKEPCYQRQCGAVGVDSSTWCNWC